jgi:hypothetical protein
VLVNKDRRGFLCGPWYAAASGSMDCVVRDRVVTPTMISRNNRRAVFSVRGRCRRFITDTSYRLLGLGMWRLGDWKNYVGRSAVRVQLEKRIGTSAVRLGAVSVW